MCLYPKLIKNPKYRPNKKNRGKPPKCTDDRLLYIPAACGKCVECRRQKANEWLTRMSEEVRGNKVPSYFITLTLNDENYNQLKEISKEKDDNEIAKIALRRWLERIRKRTGKSIKHWFVTELGENNDRIHLHGIVWDTNKELINETWQYGFTFIGEYVNESTIRYITKYMTKIDEKHKSFIGKVMCSAGIGSNYLKREDAKYNRYKEDTETNQTYRLRDGRRTRLPMYYRNKIYNEEEKEKLWIEMQEKGKTWVDGVECDIDSIEYNHLLTEARQKYEEMTGSKPTDWDEEKYWKRLKKMQQKRKEIEKERSMERRGDFDSPLNPIEV